MGFAVLLVAVAAPAQIADDATRPAQAGDESTSEVPRVPPLLPDLTPIPDPDAPRGSESTALGGDGAVGPAVSTFDFVRMAVVLAAVVGAIYLVFFLIRRATAARVNENDMIRLLGSKTLGGNRNLHLVKVGASVYLLGAADAAVNLIAEVKDKESLDSIQLEDATAVATGGRRSFTDVLGELFQNSRHGAATAPGADSSRGNPKTADAGAFLARQRQRVRQMRPTTGDPR